MADPTSGGGGGGMSSSLTTLAWMQAASSLVQAYGMRQQGKVAEANSRIRQVERERQQLYSEFAQWNAERQAAHSLAVSQRTAEEEMRQADLAASRALAVAAASGGGVSDPTIVALLARTRGEGVYRANVALWEGEERARQLKISGFGGGDFSGIGEGDPMAGYNAAAAGRVAGGTLSLYARYGLRGPNAGGGDKTGSGDSALITELDV